MSNYFFEAIKLIVETFLKNFFSEKDIEDDPEMIEMMKMLEEAKDDLEIAEEKVDYCFFTK